MFAAPRDERSLRVLPVLSVRPKRRRDGVVVSTLKYVVVTTVVVLGVITVRDMVGGVCALLYVKPPAYIVYV